MKPKSTTNLLSAFSVFKNNRIKKKKESTPKGLRNNSLTACQIKALELSAISIKRTKSNQNLKGTPSTISKGERKVKVPSVSSISGCGNPAAENCFTWLIQPTSAEEFFANVWEKKTICVNRGKNYYKGILSCTDFDRMLRTNHLEFGTNLDVVSYVNGERLTHNPDGRAYASVIWDYYQNGCSIRLLNPQTFCKPLWRLCSLLSEYFGSFCGANMYLTPPASQGFAPHYDDIEAFILQIEGKKMWKVYSPRHPLEELPRFSSQNLKQDELDDPILEVTLEPGDCLYMPRGFIHQARTAEDAHSLHITVSTYQRQTWGDLLQKLLPKALEDAMAGDVKYRESLPLNYMNYAGLVNTEKDGESREAFMRKLVQLTKGLVNFLSPDAATDQMAKDFIHSTLPPSLTQEEKARSIHGNGERWENGKIENSVELDPDVKVRFIRKRAVRLIRELNTVKLYHTFENSLVYQERDPQYVEIDYELIPAVEALLESCPEYIRIEDLPLSTLEEKMEISNLLYDKGLLQTKLPLTVYDDDEC